MLDVTLSEAIQSGSRFLQPAHKRAQGYGNALDMAEFAFGTAPIVGPYMRPHVAFPCACTRWIEKSRPIRLTLFELVIHLFNEHVCGKQDWTIDVLCDWLSEREQEFGIGDLEYYAPAAPWRLS